MSDYRIISADSHVVEPTDLWTNRIAPEFKDKAPRIVRTDDGGDFWHCENKNLLGVAFAGAQVGRRFDDPENLTQQDVFENVRPGGYIPEEHVKDMDIDGIDMSIIYPSLGLMLYRVVDSELLTAIFKAYNDWMADFCSAAPDRLKGIAMLNIDNVRVGVKELERCANMGFVGAMITDIPTESRRYFLPEYDVLWAAAQDLEMPLSLHGATNRGTNPGPMPKAPEEHDGGANAFQCNFDMYVRISLTDMIFNGVFERFPKLRIGAIEQQLAWAPFFLDRIDYNYEQRALGMTGMRFKNDMKPSDMFHRNVFIGFQDDALGIRMRDIIGVDLLQWGSDYPHQESTFPHSREVLDEILADCTEEEKAKIASGNAASIYRLD